MRSFLLSVVMLMCASAALGQEVTNPCPNAKPVPSAFRLPVSMPAGEPVEFEKQLLAYLNTLAYRNLDWCRDKWVRDTGPLMDNVEAIVHPPVHIYYSPEVSRWLLHGRQGDIPDGAVIIKEQFAPAPAERYRNLPIGKLGCSNDWTIMIRNSKASRDGWFWAELWNGSNPTKGMKFNNAYQYPNAGYGLACLRCHASAQKDLTFSSLSNIEGAPGWPLQFRVDDSWRKEAHPDPPASCGTGETLVDYLLEAVPKHTELLGMANEETVPPEVFPNHEQNAVIQEDLAALHLASPRAPAGVQAMPPETYDDVLAPPQRTAQSGGGTHPVGPNLLTSAQCLGCHSGLTGKGLGPTMALFFKDSATINVSPYGEWRWSPMGLAGRDPVFYSQLDSELAALKEHSAQQQVVDTCMTCHGAMGKREFKADHPKDEFHVDFVYERDPHQKGFKYGGLARDGISCEVCHRMAAPQDPSIEYFFNKRVNGVYEMTPGDELHGPFKDAELTTYQMNAALGIKPKYNAYIQSPQMCGSCHTILLPVLDSPVPDKKSVEQATYPEWLNSAYRNEYGSVGPTPKTCQDCHMPTKYENARANVSVPVIQDKIAIVQDLTYPMTDHLAKPSDLDVRYRETGYKRHELLGTNGFLLQMFLKPVNEAGNNEALGVRLLDYMTGLSTDLKAASDNVVQQAQQGTATVAISKWEVHDRTLVVEATVTNLAGHRFPSGVGFRRAFLELDATVNGKPFFTSGATNDKGQIVDFAGHVLPTESFTNGEYQPHFSQAHPIRSSDQVQIYEELTQNAKRQFTTSFTNRDFDIKDNRLLPIGWALHGPADMKIPEPYLHATLPVGDALQDPAYLAGKGQSIVRYEIPLPAGASSNNVHVKVALYSQTLPPYYLADRSQTKTPATARLEFLVDSLGTLEKTDYEKWKLLVAEVEETGSRK